MFRENRKKGKEMEMMIDEKEVERTNLSLADKAICRRFLPHLSEEQKNEGIPASYAGLLELYLHYDIEAAFNHSDDLDATQNAIYDILDENDIPYETICRINVPSARKSSEIRRDWGKALSSVKNGCELSGPIDYGFSEDDICALARLHKQNRFRKKIEDLLEDCNFHTECTDFASGKYDKYLAEED